MGHTCIYFPFLEYWDFGENIGPGVFFGAAFQRSAFGRSTAGNDVVATIFIRIFFFFRFSLSRPFLIEGVLGSKNLFCKSYLERPKT